MLLVNTIVYCEVGVTFANSLYIGEALVLLAQAHPDRKRCKAIA